MTTAIWQIMLAAITAETLTALLPASLGKGDIAWIQHARAWARAAGLSH